MGAAEAVVLSLRILAPLVTELVKYLTEKDAPRPAFLSTLPDTLLSEVELAKKLSEVAGRD